MSSSARATPADGDRAPRPLSLEVRRSLARVHNRTADENDLKRVVMRYALDHGWRRFHPVPARRRAGEFLTTFEGEPGFPDLVLVRDRRLVVAELKQESGGEGPEQQLWLNLFRTVALAAAGSGGLDPSGRGIVEVHTWRPRDWEQIKRCLH